MSLGLTVGLITIAAFFVLLFMGVSVTVSMMICSVVGTSFLLGSPISALNVLSDGVHNSFTSYVTSVAPMFILMGELASESKIGSDLFDCMQKLTGHRKAGLANACQVGCAIFGAICGSTTATGAMMSRVAYPQMKRYHYSDELSTGCIASGACLAALIPPSLHLITYGIVAEESISRLLLAGIITGIVLMLLFIITIKIWTLINPSVAPEKQAKLPLKERFQAIRHGGLIEIALVFIVAMGGMFAGWFTPTEAGSVGFFGMLLVSIIFKRFSFPVLKKAVVNTMVMSGMIYCLIAGASCFGKFFTLSRIPSMLGNLVANLNVPTVVIVLALTLIYLVMGCFIEAVPIILLTTPVFLPVVTSIGLSPLWFGCYLVVVVGMGGVTPPVGLSCYVVSGTTGVKLQTAFKGAIPFLLAYIAMTILMTLVPGIATWLPSVIMK